MKTGLLVLVGVLGMAANAAAQLPPDTYTLKYYNVGAAQPLQQSDPFPAASALCNQLPVTGSTINPTMVVWDDDANVGKVCKYAFPSGAALFSLPVGSYEAVLTASYNSGGSADSARAPFSRLGPPPARTGVKLIR